MTSDSFDPIKEGQRAEAWRKAMGWTREELAERLGVSASLIFNMESGQRRDAQKRYSARQFRMYRLACAALTIGLEMSDDWAHMGLSPPSLARTDAR